MITEKFHTLTSENHDSEKDKVLKEIDKEFPGFSDILNNSYEEVNNPAKETKQVYSNWLEVVVTIFSTANIQYNNYKLRDIAKKYVTKVLGLEIIEGGPMNVVDTRIPDDFAEETSPSYKKTKSKPKNGGHEQENFSEKILRENRGELENIEKRHRAAGATNDFDEEEKE